MCTPSLIHFVKWVWHPFIDHILINQLDARDEFSSSKNEGEEGFTYGEYPFLSRYADTLDTQSQNPSSGGMQNLGCIESYCTCTDTIIHI